MKSDIALIRYHERLGDVVRCLPIARHLANAGFTVYHECLPQYHRIFQNVSYVRPVAPGLGISPDRVYNLQIWPRRYEAFRASGLPWWEFVTSLYDELHGLPLHIEFDALPAHDLRAKYGLPADYSLLCPFGYSQLHPVPPQEFFALHDGLWSEGADYILADAHQREQLLDQGWPAAHLLSADLADLPALIRDARHLLTINSAPDIIASAVRETWHKIPEANPQDDVRFPGRQIVVPRRHFAPEQIR